MRATKVLPTILFGGLLSACAGTGMVSSTDTQILPAADISSAEALISPDETLESLTFPVTGSIQVNGTINGYKHPAYLVPVAKGQTLTVILESPSYNAYFNVHEATDSSGFAVFNGNFGERTARLEAPTAMTYVIRPFQPRASARRNEQVPYRLTVERN